MQLTNFATLPKTRHCLLDCIIANESVGTKYNYQAYIQYKTRARNIRPSDEY